MREHPLVVLDANVLFPFQLRNLLLHLAVEGLFRPLWSAEIIDECMRALRRDAQLTQAQCDHLLVQMRRVFASAWGSGFAGRADRIELPDEGDRHVLALAVHYEADFIVTHNLKHFPSTILHPLGTAAIDPDAFVGILWFLDRQRVLAAAEQHRCSLRISPLAPADYLTALRGTARLPRTAELLLNGGFLHDAARSPQG
ncbi:MAG TPA: PIN domain-containing protein [Longimicrobium sp.]